MFQKKLLFSIGWPFSPFYEFLMRLRERLYLSGKLPQYHAKVPVISVGNLTMGGTGKTPTVCYIANLLLANGYKPAVISRGYTGKVKEKVNIVTDGKHINLSSHEAGDEPYMLAKMLPGVVVITGKKRFLTCEHAVEQLNCNVLILDDGFQHLRVNRDLDIVLFDKNIGFGVDRVFPGGDLREPKSALDRADIFLITGNNSQNHEEQSAIEKSLINQKPDTPIYHQHKDDSLFVLNGETPVNLSTIDKNVGVFCGIANPERFKNDLLQNGFCPFFFKAFKDHHNYTSSDIQSLCNEAQKHHLKFILTTDKDIVKLDLSKFTIPVISVRLNIKIESEFDSRILRVAQAKQKDL